MVIEICLEVCILLFEDTIFFVRRLSFLQSSVVFCQLVFLRPFIPLVSSCIPAVHPMFISPFIGILLQFSISRFCHPLFTPSFDSLKKIHFF